MICSFFINYLSSLVPSLYHCDVQLVQMCWARPSLELGLAQVLHIAQPPPAPTEDWLHCHIPSKPQTVSSGSSLSRHIEWDGLIQYGQVVCYMTWIPTTLNIFSKACTDHFSFLQNSLWAQECRGRQTSGTVQCRHQSPLQSRMDCSPWGCLPKRPGDYWYPGERRCQDWVCKLLWNHFFICGSWEWAVGSSEIPSKVW